MTIQEQPKAKFKHIDFRLIKPSFDSPLTDLIIELDHLKKSLPFTNDPTTPYYVFMQIKNIFHMLESVGSARIEGNRTTVIEYIDTVLEDRPKQQESVREIANMENALVFIDKNVRDNRIDRAFVSELHKYVVSGLTEEGSKTPGEYRTVPVSIRNSDHVPPPDRAAVERYMDELFQFINQDDASKYDLLKTALAHHRFVWIHPFDNGNGRAVRLFTYAMLVKQGFNVHISRVLNPTAVFCGDRSLYYKSLSRADQGDDEGFLEWSLYVLSGLKTEIEKTDKLVDYPYLSKHILYPAINYSLEKNIVSESDANILRLAVEKQEIANGDVKKIFPAKHIADISRLLRRLKESNMLVRKKGNQRKYLINFEKNKLLRGIINALDADGFLPKSE